MKRIILALSLMISISSATFAQQKKVNPKPSPTTNATTTATKTNNNDPKQLQNIWVANLYLAKTLLDIEKPSFDKEEIKSIINSEVTIKKVDELKSYLQKMYSALPLEIVQEEKRKDYKTSIENLTSLSSTKEIVNACMELQQCIDQNLLPSTWDSKAWTNGFKNIK